MKPSKDVTEMFKRKFDEFSEEIEGDSGSVISLKTALFQGEDDQGCPYQIQILITRDEWEFCSKVAKPRKKKAK